MDANQALVELTEISSQIEAAVVFGREGTVVASTVGDERAGAMAAAGAALLQAAEDVTSAAEKPLTQLEAAGPEGSVALVREGERAVVATTRPDPTIGLVLYDLRTCLRASAPEEQKPKPRRRTRAASAPKEPEGDEAA
jgi:predicted regulator of Ras-like GTPase activity (Roadblock/LC7/MglB family)